MRKVKIISVHKKYNRHIHAGISKSEFYAIDNNFVQAVIIEDGKSRTVHCRKNDLPT